MSLIWRILPYIWTKKTYIEHKHIADLLCNDQIHRNLLLLDIFMKINNAISNNTFSDKMKIMNICMDWSFFTAFLQLKWSVSLIKIAIIFNISRRFANPLQIGNHYIRQSCRFLHALAISADVIVITSYFLQWFSVNVNEYGWWSWTGLFPFKLLKTAWIFYFSGWKDWKSAWSLWPPHSHIHRWRW